MHSQDSSTSARGWVHLKRGAIVAAVALCCVVGVGTAVAGATSAQNGTNAASVAHEGNVKTLVADVGEGISGTPASEVTPLDGYDDNSATTVAFNLTDSSNLTVTLNVQVNANCSLYIDWGDESEVYQYDADDTDSVSSLSPSHTYDAAGEQTISIVTDSADTQGWVMGWGSKSYPFVDGSCGQYLTSVTSAANAGVQTYAFYGSSSGSYPLFTTADFSECNTSNITDMSYMFYYCSALTDLDITGLDTSAVTTMREMFHYCSALTSLDVSGFNTSQVTDMYSMFHNCSALTDPDLSSFDTSAVTNMYSMFYGCKALTALDVSGFNTSKVTNMYSMFYNCSALTSLDLSSFDTSQVKTLSAMFYYCSSLAALDLSSFDTSQVTDMSYMFYYCSSLTSLDLSRFDTSQVKTLYAMFYGCKALTSLDVSGLDTSAVTTMRYMFYNCSALTALDLSSFDTSKVTTMREMFYNCSALTALDLSSFDTSKVTTMRDMFYNCSALTALDVSGFDTSKVTTASDRGNMFTGCTGLHKITLGENVDVTVEASAANDNRLPTPAFTSPYKTTGKWQALIDENAGTLGEPQDATGITKAIGDSQVTYYAQITDIAEDWFELPDSSETYNGQSHTPSVQMTDAGQEQDPSVGEEGAEPGYTVSYLDSDGNPVDEIVDAGTYSVVITGSGSPITATGNYGGTVALEFTVNAAELTEEMFTDEISEQTYTGSPIEPTVTGKNGETDLVPGTDYTVEYENNVNVGTATVTITGIGNYSGTVSKTFAIAQATLAEEMFTLDPERATYVGSAIEVSPHGEFNGIELLADTDYSCVITDQDEIAIDAIVDVGTYTFTFTGQGNFDGSCAKTCTVEKAEASIKVADVTAVYGQAIGEMGLSYEVEGRIDENDLGAIVCVVENSDNPDEDYPESTVLDAGDYTITATYTDNANYEVTVATGTLTVEPQTLDFGMFTLEPTGHVYDESATTVTVTTDLVEGDDYTLTIYDSDGQPYINALVNAGTYYFAFTGMGNYTGTVVEIFGIAGQELTEDAFSLSTTEATYTGEPLDVQVEAGALIADTDYELFIAHDGELVDINDIVDAGTYTFVFVGINNYEGTITMTFTVNAAVIDDDMFTDEIPEQTYTGSPIEPTVTGKNGETDLVPGTDYTVEYANNVNVGTATATITGIGNYSGTVTKDFTIVKATLTDEMFALDPAETTYTGSAIEVTVSGIFNGTALVANTDYSCVITDQDETAIDAIVDAGTYTFTFTGQGNFDGSCAKTCTVEKTEASIMVADVTAVYGQAIEDLGLSYEVDGLIAENDLGDITCVVEDPDNPGEYYGPSEILDAGDYTITATYTENENYEVTVATGTLTVEPQTLEDGMFTLNPAETSYTGTAATVKIETALAPDSDYSYVIYDADGNTCEIDALVDAGTYDFVFTGTGNYAGTLTLEFTIEPAKIAANMFTIEDGPFTYSGFAIEPTVASTTLEAGTDYKVTYDNNVDVTDKAVVTITGRGNYTGTVTKNFTIAQATLAEAMFTFDPERATYVGSAIEVSPHGEFNGIELLADTDYSFAITRQDETSVDEIIDAGDYIFTFTGQGNFDGSCTKTFTVDKAEASIKVADVATTYGPTIEELGLTYEVEGLIDENDLGDITCAVVKDEGADETYDPSEILNAGDYTITATYTENENYEVTVATGTLTVEPQTLDFGMFTLDPTGHVYDGKAAEITVSTGLEENKDYTLTVYDATGTTCDVNDLANFGTYYFVFSGIGNYTGTVVEIFGIAERELLDTEFSLSTTEATYTGEPVDVQVVTNLTADTDYELFIAHDGELVGINDIVDAGTYTFVFVGINNYEGTITMTFTVGKAAASIMVADASATYGPAIQDLDLGYEVEGLIDENDLGDISCVVEDPDNPGGHYAADTVLDTGVYTVSATYTENDNYEVTVATGTLTVEPQTLDFGMFALEPTGHVYDGSATTVTVTTDLAEGDDYTLTVYDAAGTTCDVNDLVNAGTYYFAFTGMGNYAGTLMLEFTIEPAEIDEAMFKIEDGPFTYSGFAIEPTVTSTLQSGDYTVEYSNNTEVGQATITITGQGNYTGEVDCTFNITAAAITADMFTVDTADQTYTGSAIEPTVTSTLQASDYTVAYSNNTEIGQATITITGQGNYTGTLTYNFNIVAAATQDEIDELEDEVTDAYDILGDVVISTDGSDVPPDTKWVTPEVYEALVEAIEAAQAIVESDNPSAVAVARATAALQSAIATFEAAEQTGTKTDETTTGPGPVVDNPNGGGNGGNGGGNTGGSKLTKQTIKAKKSVKAHKGKKAKIKVTGAKTALKVTAKGKAKKALKIKVKKGKITVKAKKKGTFKIQVYAAASSKYAKSNVVTIKVKVK